ncbi:MAG: helix-turn-helix domain-containing protein [Lachnospiraceae bacterium]|nr:helix-turn-helix domain-containing protein [Lachnospiraceae bacterium]
MEQIRELLLIYLRTKYRASKSHVFINQTFNLLMNKGTIQDADVSRLLDKRHWLREDKYYLMAFRYPIILNSEPELASYINIIHMQFPKALAAVANQAVLLVLREADYDLNDYEYLLNGCSISATVRSMNLHRNTLIYHIQRLQELFSMQFDNAPAEFRFSLMMSCMIVRAEASEEVK